MGCKLVFLLCTYLVLMAQNILSKVLYAVEVFSLLEGKKEKKLKQRQPFQFGQVIEL